MGPPQKPEEAPEDDRETVRPLLAVPEDNLKPPCAKSGIPKMHNPEISPALSVQLKEKRDRRTLVRLSLRFWRSTRKA